jgi:thiol-disulfide isomerase/thioredoxin
MMVNRGPKECAPQLIRKDSNMRNVRWFLLIGPIVLAAASGVPAQEKKIEMVSVKYDGLKQEIFKQRGKVVLVDFWATYCPPCMAAFPKIIDMQKKHADRGFVVLSVSADDATNPEKVKKANAFLNRVEAPFRNLLLDEPWDEWTKRLEIKALPCYYVFDRRGKWVRFRGDDYKDGIPYGEVEKTIVNMLSEK